LGSHIASNALAVLLTAKALGVATAKAAAALAGFAPLKGRGARVALGDIELIDESYNANPASMTAALNLLKESRPQSGGRRIAVLGDMLELGSEAAALHRAIAKDVATSATDLVFLCGAQMRALWEALPAARRGAYAATSSELVSSFLDTLRSGDVVLVKGSFGSRMSVIVDALKMRGAAAA
jgi:UDP-N-acetylmuramoyl-tripeptide--D-alanyl-D-alanine ligase